MRLKNRSMGLLGAMAFSGLILGGLPGLTVIAADKTDVLAEGKKIAFDRAKGNCLACHMIQGGESPGTIAPPLFSMKIRFPDKEKLRVQIEDPMSRNPETSMPPFGRHEILSDAEINKVVEFIWSL